jgi:hypothetical protein
MSYIGADQLDAVLSALGEQLELADERVHLVVIGGSGLIAIDAVARATRDVDVGLERNWLNPGPTSLLLHGLPSGFAARMIAREYGPGLRVSFAARVDQVFLKLYAAADRREPRDFDDLRRLEPTGPELRDAARWARTHNMPGPFDDALTRALGELGVEDAGRDA